MPKVGPPKVVRKLDHPRLGELSLLCETWRSPNLPWSLKRFYRWEGTTPNGVDLALEDAGDQETTPRAELIERTLSVLDRRADIVRAAAEAMLPIAPDWAASGDLPVPNLQGLIDAFVLAAIHVWPDTTDVWIEDTTDLFAGHGISVRMNAAGVFLEAGLSG